MLFNIKMNLKIQNSNLAQPPTKKDPPTKVQINCAPQRIAIPLFKINNVMKSQLNKQIDTIQEVIENPSTSRVRLNTVFQSDIHKSADDKAVDSIGKNPVCSCFKENKIEAEKRSFQKETSTHKVKETDIYDRRRSSLKLAELRDMRKAISV